MKSEFEIIPFKYLIQQPKLKPNNPFTSITAKLGEYFCISNYSISKLFMYLFLSLTNLCNAQETEVFVDSNFTYECDCKNWSDGLSISLGISLNAEQEINSYLNALEAPATSNEILWFGLGWSFRSEEDVHLFDVMVALGDASSNNDNFKLSYRENDIMFRYYRKILSSSEGSSFSLGLQTSYLFAGLQLTKTSTEVDLNNGIFVPNSQNLSQNAWMLGPSFNFNWVLGEKQKRLVRVILSYDFSLYASDWGVRDASTFSTFKETRDRIQLSLLIPLFTR